MPPAATQALERWELQQAAYIADRERRFTVMLEVLEHARGNAFLALDLACGPGSLAKRVLERFPRAKVVGIDYDPSLLHIAEQALESYDDRLRLIDADLTDPRWTRALADETPDAILSTTALHWLTPPQLVELYRRAANLLAPGGILLNGDHLRFDGRSPTLRQIAAAHDEATQRAAFAAGAPTWEEWWGDHAERDLRFESRADTPPAALDFHLAALVQAGFSEVGTVWQYLDDYIVFARR